MRQHDAPDQRVRERQARIAALTYDLAGAPGVDHQVLRPTMQALSKAAEAVLEAGTSIRCQAGAVLAAHLTADMPTAVLRLPLSFKTRVRTTGAVHRHIVLAVRDARSRQWGSMGISRSPRLMDKPVDFSSLSALVREFEQSYDACGHELRVVYLGLPFSTSRVCRLPIVWRALHVVVGKEGTADGDSDGPPPGDGWTQAIEHYEGSLSALVAHHTRTMGFGLPSPASLLQMLVAKGGPLRMHDLTMAGRPPPPRPPPAKASPGKRPAPRAE